MSKQKSPNHTVSPVNEIVAGVTVTDAYLSNAEFARKLRSDPKGLLSELSEQPLGPFNVHLVQNTEDTVHVPLPDYSVMDRMHERPVSSMSDQDLEQIAGGEIIGAIMALCIGIGAGVGVGGSMFASALAGGAIIGATTGAVAGAAATTAVGLGVGLSG